MTLREFALLVKTMRDAQKGYFHTPSHPNLASAKKLESTVDQRTDEILNGSLFERPAE